MEKKFDVIGFGDPFQDLDIQLSKLPETNVNMRMNDYCFMGGGNVPTAMVAAARLGLKSSILGVVGDDMLGRLATADFTYNHVDTSHLKVAAGKRTNFCLCVAEQEIDGKEFISKPGDFDPLTPSDLDKDYIQSAKALHIGQFTPAIVKACEWMHEAGGVVSIDAAYYRPDIYENYRHLDIFIGCCFAALILVILNAGNIAPAFASIFKGAFAMKAVGGGIVGSGVKAAVTWGMKRGVFSNEAGLGSSVMVHSNSNVKEPVTQGMWGIFEVFADTLVVCTLTALAVLTSGLVDLNTGAMLTSTEKTAMVAEAFSLEFGAFGSAFIAVAILLFAFSTVLGWSHYGTKAFEYLFGTKATMFYKIIFVVFIMVGATMQLDLAWDLSDTFNGLMAIPNLIGVLALSGLVRRITKNYIDRTLKGKDVAPMYSAFEDIQQEEMRS